MQARSEKKKSLALLEAFLADRSFRGNDSHAEASELQGFLRSQGAELALKTIHRLMGELVEEGRAGRIPCTKLGEPLRWNEAGKAVDGEGKVQKSFKFLYCFKSASGGVRGSEELKKAGIRVSASELVRDVLEAGFLTGERLAEERGLPQVVFRVGDAFVRLVVSGQELPLSVLVGRPSAGAPGEGGGVAGKAPERACYVELRSGVLSRFGSGWSGGQYRIQLGRNGQEAAVVQLSAHNPTLGKTLSAEEVELFFRDLDQAEVTTKVQGHELVARKLRRGLEPVAEGSGSLLKLPAYLVVNGVQALVLGDAAR